MIALVQRSGESSVSVDGKTVGKISQGITVFVGVFAYDSQRECDYLAKKIASLRIFSDDDGKMNRSVLDTEGQALVISNFTLCADAKKGTRPSYDKAMRPDGANKLYEYFCKKLSENGIKKVEQGVFGAYMTVSVSNDGPISILLDTDKLMPKNEVKNEN